MEDNQLVTGQSLDNPPSKTTRPKRARATRVREVTLPDGRQGYEYSDGSIRDGHGYMLVALRRTDASRVEATRNGIVVRGRDGKFQAGTKPANLITAETARTLALLRQQQKRERVVAGANRALLAIRKRKLVDGKWEDDGPEWEDPNDLDFVEAIAEAQAAKALLVIDPTSTRAAQFVYEQAGVGEQKQQEPETHVVRHEYDVSDAMLSVLDRLGGRKQIEDKG